MEACQPPDKFNGNSYDTIVLAVTTVLIFAGMLINAFIVAVHCIAWMKKKSLTSSEKILMFLGCSRFCLLCITWVYSFLSTIYPGLFYVNTTPQIFSALLGFFISSNLWISACLCVFYCVKIANFRHIFFNYLKVNIDRIVPWLLLGSVFLSLFICIPVYKIPHEVQCNYLNATLLGSSWMMNIKIDRHVLPAFFVSGVGFSLAFVTLILPALLLLFSLWRHKRKMQTSPVRNLSMDAHVKAMKAIMSFFFTYSIYFTCLIFWVIYDTQNKNPLMVLCFVLQHAFPVVHSLILIFSNPQLEKILLKTLHSVKCKVCIR
ncbi:taste receptor type 2 member 9-like [Rhea pennata]|uniref:taste receptor type 2 member 9-like n=1 Tax=Rhea pennata TaxID=8795 RepID=UPI002E26E831